MTLEDRPTDRLLDRWSFSKKVRQGLDLLWRQFDLGMSLTLRSDRADPQGQVGSAFPRNR